MPLRNKEPRHRRAGFSIFKTSVNRWKSGTNPLTSLPQHLSFLTSLQLLSKQLYDHHSLLFLSLCPTLPFLLSCSPQAYSAHPLHSASSRQPFSNKELNHPLFVSALPFELKDLSRYQTKTRTSCLILKICSTCPVHEGMYFAHLSSCPQILPKLGTKRKFVHCLHKDCGYVWFWNEVTSCPALEGLHQCSLWSSDTLKELLEIN